jgi:hypothetical protein
LFYFEVLNFMIALPNAEKSYSFNIDAAKLHLTAVAETSQIQPNTSPGRGAHLLFPVLLITTRL